MIATHSYSETPNARLARKNISQYIVLSMLLHLLLMLLFGVVSGNGERKGENGEKNWGSLTVTWPSFSSDQSDSATPLDLKLDRTLPVLNTTRTIEPMPLIENKLTPDDNETPPPSEVTLPRLDKTLTPIIKNEESPAFLSKEIEKPVTEFVVPPPAVVEEAKPRANISVPAKPTVTPPDEIKLPPQPIPLVIPKLAIPEPKPVPKTEPKPEPKPVPIAQPKIEAIPVEPTPTPPLDLPKTEPTKIETPKVETPKVEPQKIEAPKVEAPKVETPKIEAPKITPAVVEPKPAVTTVPPVPSPTVAPTPAPVPTSQPAPSLPVDVKPVAAAPVNTRPATPVSPPALPNAAPAPTPANASAPAATPATPPLRPSSNLTPSAAPSAGAPNAIGNTATPGIEKNINPAPFEVFLPPPTAKPAPEKPLPKFNLDDLKNRARDMVRQDTKQKPFITNKQDTRSKMEKDFDKLLTKPKCEEVLADLKKLAVVPMTQTPIVTGCER